HRARAQPGAKPGAHHLQPKPRGRVMPEAGTTIARRTVPAFGTFATLLTVAPAAIGPASEILGAELRAIDAACSRPRRDSALSRVNRAQGRAVKISPLFTEALTVALTAARLTDGDG